MTGIFTLCLEPCSAHTPVPCENLAHGDSLSLGVMEGGIFPNNLTWFLLKWVFLI